MPLPRLDPFTTVHKGVRALLFDAATATAHVTLTSDRAIDLLGERIDRAAELVAAHERAEDAVVLPVLRRLDAGAAARLRRMHDELEGSLCMVRRAARALVLAPSSDRTLPCRQLLQALDELTVTCLAHVRHEETVVTAILWGGLGDGELAALDTRMDQHLCQEHGAVWRSVLAPALGDP